MSSIPEAAPLRVVIVDDHPFYRQGLARSLRANGIDVVAEAANGEAAIRAVDETAPDVVVMDLKMPRMSGSDATRALTDRTPATRILVLSVSAEEDDVTDAFLAGASGYVLKERPVGEVIAGIRAIASGQPHISPDIAMPLLRRVAGRAHAATEPPGVSLSAQERTMLDLLAAGTADHRIADTLGIGTDELHVQASSVLMRLHLESDLRSSLRTPRRGH